MIVLVASCGRRLRLPPVLSPGGGLAKTGWIRDDSCTGGHRAGLPLARLGLGKVQASAVLTFKGTRPLLGKRQQYQVSVLAKRTMKPAFMGLLAGFQRCFYQLRYYQLVINDCYI